MPRELKRDPDKGWRDRQAGRQLKLPLLREVDKYYGEDESRSPQ